MSHFYVMAIVPKDTTDIEQKLGELLEPYSENREVEPYHNECRCGQRKAFDRSEKILNQVIGEEHKEKMEQAIGKWEDWHKDGAPPGDTERRKIWLAFVVGVNSLNTHVMQILPEYKIPDPDCDECKGTGKHVETTTYNPDSKWDIRCLLTFR